MAKVRLKPLVVDENSVTIHYVNLCEKISVYPSVFNENNVLACSMNFSKSVDQILITRERYNLPL